MRVISFRAENFKRLVVADITPEGDIVTLTGKNAQGKSSVLDALWLALEGADKKPAEAIRRGADKARIRVDLGKYIVTRTISRKADGGETTSVKVESPDGAVWPSPQKLLDDLIGDLSFDPLEFARMRPNDQFDQMAKFVPGVDFKDIAMKNRGDFEKRSDVNRRAKEARAAAGVIALPAEIPEKVDDTALVAELSGATQREAEIAEHARQAQALRERLNATQRKVSDNSAERDRLSARIRELDDELGPLTEQVAQLSKDVEAFPYAPARIDTVAVAEKLRQAQATNRNVDELLRKSEQRASLERLAKSLEDESDALTKSIETRNAAKAKAVSEAKMPVEGLSFGDGEILLNGVPFSQGSSAEQLRTSVAIAAAANPTLRVIHIRDGSLLDSDSMAWLAEYAKANDLQVWCEVVADDAKVGVVIEDGRVRGAEADKANAA